MPIKPEEEPKNTRSVVRAFHILELLCQSGKGMRIKDLTKQTELDKATIFRLLSTLRSLGYVEKAGDSDHYVATMRIATLSTHLLEGVELRGLAMPVLQELAKSTGFSVNLSIPENDNTVIVENIKTQSYVRVAFHVGRRSPFYSTGTGKVFLSAMSTEELEAYLGRIKFVAITEKTICTPQALREEIATIRKRGFAIDDNENTMGVSCVAAPIKDVTGKVTAAVSVTGISGEILVAVDKLSPKVLHAAAEISRRLETIAQQNII